MAAIDFGHEVQMMLHGDGIVARQERACDVKWKTLDECSPGMFT